MNRLPGGHVLTSEELPPENVPRTGMWGDVYDRQSWQFDLMVRIGKKYFKVTADMPKKRYVVDGKKCEEPMSWHKN